MQLKPLKRMGGVIATAIVALMLIGCRGAAGQNGTNGTNGTNGNNGPSGTPGAAFAIDANTMSPDDWGGLALQGQITSVTMGGAPVVNFKVTDGHGVPIKGLGWTTQASGAPLPNLSNMSFTCAKLVPGTLGSPSKWVSYIVTSTPTASATTPTPRTPTADTTGTLVDNGDGTYKYTFWRNVSTMQATLDAATYDASKNQIKTDLGDVTYEPNLTHRIVVYIGGNARGTSTNTPTGVNSGIPATTILTPANINYDFIPATGAPVTVANEQREIVNIDSCNTCHTKLRLHGNRTQTKFCMVCHTEQVKYGSPEASMDSNGNYTGFQMKMNTFAVANFPNMVHKIHMGEELTKTGYLFPNATGIQFNEITYPQDQRNCVKCHTASTATPQGDNWFNKPSRVACGSCHDGVDWSTGNGHGKLNEGGPQLNDQNCATVCHDPATIKTNHVPVLPIDTGSAWHVSGGNSNTNVSSVAAFTNNLPAGASKVTWEIKSFVITGGKPVITFRFNKDGSPVVFNTYPAKTEMMDNFIGGPSVYVAFAVPQDGIATPADWNATASTFLKNIWRGDGKDMGGRALQSAAKATLVAGTGADAGYYVITFSEAVIPPTAGMITAGIGYTYGIGAEAPTPPTLPWTSTQPLTQTNVPGYPTSVSPRNPNGLVGGLAVPAPNVTKLIGALPTGFPATSSDGKTGPANTARRAIVTTQKCNDCHGALGIFTAKTYHAGQRNDATTCTFCHNTSRVNNGWGVNIKDAVHAIHGAGKRANKFSWEASAGDKYWTVTYPGVLNNCERCHVPGSYDFGIAANANAVPNLLWTTVATTSSTSGPVPTPVPVVVTGNEIIPGTYWSPFVTAGSTYGSGFSYNAATPGSTTAADPRTLVNSPYVAACANCHDSTMALSHMKANGGSFYVPRSTVQVAGALVNNEQCFLCHSAGKVADTRLVHMNFK